MTMYDSELLRQFARDRSEEAFAALVKRHVDLVYSAALRQVCSSQLAEDVSQSVFLDLSRNAEKLKLDTILTAWLYRVTRRTAIDVVRTESRRQLREQIAVELADMNSPDTQWNTIAPLLDEAMETLDEEERSSILLRYFENKSLREVEKSLGTSDDAAQKRVSRAVERLREYFSKNGIAVGSSGFVALLSANAVQSAPMALSATISSAAALGLAIKTTGTIAAGKTLIMTTTQKALIATTLAAALGTGVYELAQNFRLQNDLQRMEQRLKPLAEQNEQLRLERDEIQKQLLSAQQDAGQWRIQTAELPKLRGELARLKNTSREIAQTKTTNENYPTEMALKSWLNRVKILKQRFEQWPGKKTPELDLLTEQDWLEETQKRLLESDKECRDAMGQLRWRAKTKFGDVVNEALEQFIKSNNKQLPSDLSQLMPYIKSPMDSILQGYEIAKPGWVTSPKPSSPNSERAEKWAIVEKGSFTPDGIAIRDGTDLADPEYDTHVVIYRGGSFAYGK